MSRHYRKQPPSRHVPPPPPSATLNDNNNVINNPPPLSSVASAAHPAMSGFEIIFSSFSYHIYLLYLLVVCMAAKIFARTNSCACATPSNYIDFVSLFRACTWYSLACTFTPDKNNSPCQFFRATRKYLSEEVSDFVEIDLPISDFIWS